MQNKSSIPDCMNRVFVDKCAGIAFTHFAKVLLYIHFFQRLVALPNNQL